MNVPEVFHETERPPRIGVVPPMSETLHSLGQTVCLWPELSAAQASLGEQVAKHAADIQSVQAVVGALPLTGISLRDAAETKVVSEQQIGHFFDVLSDTLDNPDYTRLALYLPFEFLPGSAWEPRDKTMGAAANRFRQSYMAAWHGLLGTHDVRANFVDGDVLEEEFRTADLPRVVKAAHLVPQLLEKGLLDTSDVAKILDNTTDPLLIQSILEASGKYPGPNHQENTGHSSQRRAAWLADRLHEKNLISVAKRIAVLLQQGQLTEDGITATESSQTSEFSRQALIEGIYQAIATGDDPGMLYAQYSHILDNLRQTEDPELTDRLVSTARRLSRLGIISAEVLDRHDDKLTTLAPPLSENLKLIPEQIHNLQQITAEVAASPQLSAYVYPVAVVGGSLLKGYGSLNSDLDVSVFLKPQTPKTMLPQLRELLHKTFVNDDGSYEPIEFWLQSPGSGPELVVHNFPVPDQHVADKHWTHILFNGAWVGDLAIIAEIQKNLLPGYFYDSKKTIEGVSDRSLYLERIEQDSLQYRLLHRGYARHYPLTARPLGIDESVFWDPGYRLLATQLFMHNVFLPKLKP